MSRTAEPFTGSHSLEPHINRNPTGALPLTSLPVGVLSSYPFPVLFVLALLVLFKSIVSGCNTVLLLNVP
jgi:hypothetical protein